MKLGTLTLLMFLSVIAFCNVTPSFSCDATRGCSPLVVHITDQSAGTITSWNWDLGNGNTSTQQNPSATYFTPGNYTIKLIVSDGISTDSVTQIVRVFRVPSVDFISDRVTACPNDSIHFTTQLTIGDAPISQYAWGFGNGISNDSMNPAYRYTQAGVYDVTLVVQDSNGCTANASKLSFIQIWAAPTAAYTVSPRFSCDTTQLVTFTDQSQGTGLIYQWSFGDSTFSSLSSMTHLYRYGKYTSTLMVTNANGCKSQTQQNLGVVNVVASFNVDKRVACAGEDVSFICTSPMGGTVWAWNFGDGGTSNKQSPKHVYANPGIYTVTFVIRDASCKDSITKVGYITITQGFSLSFNAIDRNSCTTPFTVNFTSQASTTVHYSWDFGDGNSDTTANPSNTYTTPSAFSVILTAVDSNGCTVISAAPGYINTSKPLVKFTADTMVCPGMAVRFTNRTVDGVTYLWHFGDGDTSTAVNPSHLYRTYGHYTVSLTATDSIGCDSTLVKPSFIHVDSTKVNFSVGQTYSFCPPLVTTFTSVVSRSDLKLKWDFGDGYTDTAANPTHIFLHPGVYTVKLTGVSTQGCSDSITYPQLIVVQGPSGHFNITPNNGCVPLVVNFSGTASANTQSITCDLGNGVLFNDSLNFSYTYTAARTYHPKFILTDHVGCSIPFDIDSVIARPSPALHLQDSAICAGRSMQISLGPDHYTWTGTACSTCGAVPIVTGNTATATLSPTVNTTYAVTATNNIGCSTSGQFNVNVVQMQVLPPHDTIRVCKDAATRISTVQYDTVLWSPSTYLSSVTDTATTCTPSASISYTVIAHSGQGCPVSQQVPVKVEVLTGNFAVTPAAGCTPLVVSFTGSPSGNTQSITYDLGDGTAYNGPANFNHTYSAVRSYQPTVTLTDQAGCTTAIVLDTITTHPLPVLHLQDSTVCLGQSVTMMLGTDHYTWQSKVCDSCGRIPSITDTTAVAVLAPTVNTTYTVTAQSSFGCTTTGQFHINVVQVKILTPHDTIVLCKDESVRITGIYGDSVRWTPTSYLSNPNDTAPICIPYSSMSYNVMSYNKDGCATSQAVPVKVNNKMIVTLSKDTSVCPGGAVQLAVSATDTSTQGVSYSWSPASYLDNSTSTTTNTQSLTQTKTFHVITTSGGCPPDTSVVTVHVRPAATVRLPGTVTTTTHAEVPLEPMFSDLATYSWTAADPIACADCKATTISPAASQIVYLRGADQYGCPASDSMLIHVLQCDPESIFVPNTFTPNADGLHDVLYLHSRTLAQLAYFRVFDRWGAMVYETRNITDGWDGMINGKAAEQGVYLYTIGGKCDNGYDVEKNGTVTLVR